MVDRVCMCVFWGFSCDPGFLRHQEKCLLWRFPHRWYIKRSSLLKYYKILSVIKVLRRNMAYGQSNNVCYQRAVWSREYYLSVWSIVHCCTWTEVLMTDHSKCLICLPVTSYKDDLIGCNNFPLQSINSSELQCKVKPWLEPFWNTSAIIWQQWGL